MLPNDVQSTMYNGIKLYVRMNVYGEMQKTGEEAVIASFNSLCLYSPELTEDN